MRHLLLLACWLGVLLPYTQYGVVQERIYKRYVSVVYHHIHNAV